MSGQSEKMQDDNENLPRMDASVLQNKIYECDSLSIELLD